MGLRELSTCFGSRSSAQDGHNKEHQMTWRDHLTPEEAERLTEMNADALAVRKERRRIFDRAFKRAKRAQERNEK